MKTLQTKDERSLLLFFETQAVDYSGRVKTAHMNAADMEIAKQWIDANIDKNEWPEDEWTSLNEEYDMNIYIDEDGKKRATVFPVINGETDLETFVEII